LRKKPGEKIAAQRLQNPEVSGREPTPSPRVLSYLAAFFIDHLNAAEDVADRIG